MNESPQADDAAKNAQNWGNGQLDDPGSSWLYSIVAPARPDPIPWFPTWDRDSAPLAAQVRSLLQKRHWRRLLLVSLALPIAIVCFSEMALRHAVAEGWSLSSSLAVYALMVAQVALLSLTVARALDNWRWRIVTFGWLMILVQLTLYRAATFDVGRFDSPAANLAYAFISAELSGLVLWGVFGSWNWPLRLPAVLVLASLALTTAPFAGIPWLSHLRVQVVAVTIICVCLRVAGYTVQLLGAEVPDGVEARQRQFTLAHLFVWVTAVAIVTNLLRVLWPILVANGKVMVPHLLLGGCCAAAGLGSFWAALGNGHFSLRLAMFCFIAYVSGWLVQNFGPSYVTWAKFAPNYWFLWIGLAQCFLVAMLLLWNATGVRLLYVPRYALRWSPRNLMAPWLRG